MLRAKEIITTAIFIIATLVFVRAKVVLVNPSDANSTQPHQENFEALEAKLLREAATEKLKPPVTAAATKRPVVNSQSPPALVIRCEDRSKIICYYEGPPNPRAIHDDCETAVCTATSSRIHIQVQPPEPADPNDPEAAQDRARRLSEPYICDTQAEVVESRGATAKLAIQRVIADCLARRELRK